MKMITIKTKIIFAYTIVFGLMFCVFAYVVYQDTKKAEIAKLDAELQIRAAKLSADLGEEENETPTDTRAARIIKRVMESDGRMRARLISRAGEVVVGDSVLASIPIKDPAQIFHAGQASDVVRINGHHQRSLWIPIEINDQPQFVLQLTLPMIDVQENLERLRYQFYIGIPLALLITALAAYFITKMAFHPMTRMIETARHITAKNLDQRLTLPKARDEIRLLGETLNNMIGRLEVSFQSQKQFIADASHEIRTPLTVLCGELEYADKSTTDPLVKESIRTSLSEIDRLKKLTDDLLLLAKLDASQLTVVPERFRLDELLLECTQLVAGIAGKKHIQFMVRMNDVVEIDADRDKLKSVILNLLDNSIKYSPDDTVITLDLTSQFSQTNNILLQITDQGSGIPQSALPNIFKRFSRVETARTEHLGSGLGLAIVEQLVVLHGGSISVQSEEGKGTRFTIILPAAYRD